MVIIFDKGEDTMFKDRIMIGALIGILADTIKLIANYIMFQLNFTEVVFWQIVATRFLDREYLFMPVAYFIGGVADLVVTAVLGVVFVIIIYFSGKDYLWIKGIGYAMFLWVSLFGTVLGASVQQKIPQGPSAIMVTIVAHFVYGLGFALFTRYLYKEEKG